MNGLEVRRPVTRAVVLTVLCLVLIAFASPFIYLLLTSFKPPSEAIAVPPRVLPTTWAVTSYVQAFAKVGVAASFVNSLSTAAIATALSLVLAVPAAYSVSRFATRFGQLFFFGTLVLRMVPPVTVGVPLLATLRFLKVYDTPFGLALAHATIALPLSVWLLSSFFEGLPEEIEEAARVDGCSRLGALFRVVLPSVSGGLAVTSLFAFLASWNEFLFALLLTATRSQTTPIMIQSFQTQHGLDWGAMAALAVVYSAPVVVLTLFIQRHIVAGLTLGAVKG